MLVIHGNATGYNYYSPVTKESVWGDFFRGTLANEEGFFVSRTVS